MKKYILIPACGLLQSAVSLSSQAHNCPTSFSKAELNTFEAAVIKATLVSKIHRRVFSYANKTWYMEPQYWDEFIQKNKTKRTGSILKIIKFERAETDEKQLNKVRCFYEQTRITPYYPEPIILEFRMSYLE